MVKAYDLQKYLMNPHMEVSLTLPVLDRAMLERLRVSSWGLMRLIESRDD